MPDATVRGRKARRTTPARLSLVEGAAYAGVSTRTLRRYIAAGLLPGYRLGPRLVQVDPADLDRLARRIPTGGGAA